jgi:hypothetical protein
MTNSSSQDVSINNQKNELPDINYDYRERSYSELSEQFRHLIVQVFKLIPAMYNRLTLIDGLTHDEALEKMHNDHENIVGFSLRNIYRYLPSDNPNVPKRVVPPRHKNSIAKLNSPVKLSEAESLIEKYNKAQSTIEPKIGIDCPSCLDLRKKVCELEEALDASTRFTKADNLSKYQSKREFRVALKIVDLKLYLLKRRKVDSHTSEICIIVKVDIERGTVISATVDNTDLLDSQ